MKVITILLGLVVGLWASGVQAHTGTLDAYGCHSNKALYGTTAKRECHTGLLAGQTFASTTAEYKAYIAAQDVVINSLRSNIAALTIQIAVLENEIATLKAGQLPPITVFKSVTDNTGAVWSLTGDNAPYTVRFPGGMLDPEGAWASDIRVADGIAEVQWIQDLTWWVRTGSSWTPIPLPPVVIPPSQVTATLNWDANKESDIAGYEVHYGTSSGVYTRVIDVGNVTTYSLPGLTADVLYYFAVKAYNTHGLRGDLSTEVSIVK